MLINFLLDVCECLVIINDVVRKCERAIFIVKYFNLLVHQVAIRYHDDTCDACKSTQYSTFLALANGLKNQPVKKR